jgi:Zn-dependent peptidase ImmA (M78 family)/plasmid maintenance system antidote protein VapI
MQERGLAARELAQGVRRDLPSVSRLLYGVEPLTAEWAVNLSKVLGANPKFWLRREELYRADLERLCGVAGIDRREGWLHDLPLKEMVQFGWISQGSTAHETALNACAFFGVTTAEAFERKYQSLLSSTAYRTSTAFPTRPSALAAWLRQGEIEASTIDCAPWSDAILRESISEILPLTRKRNPASFLPELEHLLANCGVAMVVTRSVDGCRASGATRFLNSKRALMQLSFRYLVDDQFWFTVFHEIGHLLLHSQEALFLEGLELRNSRAEVEADEFAVNTLFAKVGVDALDRVEISKFDIARLAHKAGIAPGIVVGQLQARGRVPFKHFNFLKARYDWTAKVG